MPFCFRLTTSCFLYSTLLARVGFLVPYRKAETQSRIARDSLINHHHAPAGFEALTTVTSSINSHNNLNQPHLRFAISITMVVNW